MRSVISLYKTTYKHIKHTTLHNRKDILRMSTVYVDDITLLSQSLQRVKETSYESVSEEPGLSPRMTESNLYPLIRLSKNSLLLSSAKLLQLCELYVRNSVLCLYFSRYSNMLQGRHQRHRRYLHRYILPHPEHRYLRTLHNVRIDSHHHNYNRHHCIGGHSDYIH